MRHRLTYRARAQSDLIQLYEYIRDRSGRPTVAKDYVDQIHSACEKLVDVALMGRSREEFGPGLRSISFRRRVTIIYRVNAQTVQIVRILYGCRDLDQALC